MTWAEALDTATAGLREVRDRGSAVGVLGSARATNEENYLAMKLARGGIGTGNLDSCLQATYLPLARGIARGSERRAPRGSLLEIEESEVIILFDGDLARSHPRAAFAVMRAVSRGGRLVTFSSLRTQLARLATMHVTVAPGGQYAVAIGLLASVLDTGAAEDMPEGWTLELPPVDVEEEVKEAGRWYGGAGKASLVIAPEAVIGTASEPFGEAIGLLSRMSGQLDRSGSVVLPLPVRWNLRGACEMGVAPDVLPGGERLDDAATLDRLAQAWGRPPSIVSGHAAAAMIDAVRGLLVVAADPPSVLRNSGSARESLANLDCLVVLDAFVTPTVRAAHVVLPIASYAENEGTYTSADGRVQRLRPCVPPPGSARPGWRVLTELAAPMGLASEFDSTDGVLAEIRRVVTGYEAVDKEALDYEWGTVVRSKDGQRRDSSLQLSGAVSAPHQSSYLLTLDGVFDWGSDPLVAFSPTLSRDFRSRLKLYGSGLVEMNSEDAKALGARSGWPVQVKSEYGEATLPMVVRAEVARGILQVPFAFRDQVSNVLGGQDVVSVQVTRQAG